MDSILKHLKDGEKILWSKKADYKLLDKYDILSIPLTLLVFGGISLMFSLYLYIQFSQNPGTAFYFLTAGLLVYVLSFYFILGRFLYRKKRRSREHYYITNKRAILLTSLVYDELEDVPLKNAQINVSGKNIFFSQENPSASLFYNLGLDALLKMRPKRTLVFSGIENPAEVLEFLTKNNEEGDNA